MRRAHLERIAPGKALATRGAVNGNPRYEDREARAGEGRGIVTGRRGEGHIQVGAAVEVLVTGPGLYLLAGDKLFCEQKPLLTNDR